MGSHVRSVARRCHWSRGCERVRESPDGAGFHSHDKAGRPQSHRAHCRRIAVGPHVGEAVQGGGYPSFEHREERGGRGSLEGHWRRVCRELVPPIVQRGLVGSRESHRGHSRVRRDGRWNSRDGHSDSFRHVSASAVPGSGSPRVRTSDGPHRVQVRRPRQKKQRVPAVCWRGQLVLGWLVDALPFRQVWGGAPRCVHQKGSGWLEDDLLDVFGTNLSLEDLAKSPEEYLATLQSQTDKKFVVLPNGPL